MTETAGDAHFITEGSQQDYLTMHSARRVIIEWADQR